MHVARMEEVELRTAAMRTLREEMLEEDAVHEKKCDEAFAHGLSIVAERSAGGVSRERSRELTWELSGVTAALKELGDAFEARHAEYRKMVHAIETPGCLCSACRGVL